MNLQEQIHRIKSMMGIIVEDDTRLNQILDKISSKGMKSLNNREKTFLYGLNRKDAPQEIKTYDYKIVVTSNKNYSYEMIKSFIKRLLKNLGTEIDVNQVFFGLGMGLGYEIKLNNYFLYEDEIRNNLINNGFQIIDEGPIINEKEPRKQDINKVQKQKEDYDISLIPNNQYNLTTQQELGRIGKILTKNNIKTYFTVTDGDTIKLTLPRSSDEEKDNIFRLLSNSGYNVTKR
jgi:hypothetical protein